MNLIFDMEEIRINVAKMIERADMSPFYRKVGKVLLNAVADNFMTEGAYFQRGMTWRPLAKSTVAERMRKGYYPINILRRTAGNAGLAGSIIFTADSSGVEVGTNLYYAKYLHYGTSKMPARPILPENELPPEVLEDIVDIYERFVNSLLK